MQQLLLPKGWKWARLGEVCEVVSGFGFPLKHQGNSNQEIPFYKVSDMNLAGNEKEMINHNNSLSREEVVTLKYRIYPSNTIIFPKIGAAIATNKKRLLTKPSIFDNNVMGLISSDNVSFSFLYYWMQSFNISSWASQSQPPSIRKSTVENYKIPLPPLSTQHKIVEILEEADNLRKLRHQADEKMENVIPSLFVEMFGDPATNPKGWEVRKMGEVCDVRDGTHDTPQYQANGIPLITSKNLIGDNIDFENVQYISEEDHNKIIQRSLVENGDILFAMIGTIGNPVIVNANKVFSIKNVALLKFKNASLLINYYQKHLLNNLSVINKMTTSSRGVTQKFVSLNILRNFQIPLPPLLLQQEFAKLVEDIEAEKARQAESGKKLDELFNSLMQRAFIGELVV